MCQFPLNLFTGTVLTWLTGCALFGSSEPPKADYTVSAPQHWKIDEKADSDLAYLLPSGNTITVTSSCTRNTRAPLELLTKHLLIGTRNVQIKKREKLSIQDQEGLYSSVKATVDEIPFRMELFVMARNMCIFDFMLMSPKEIQDSEISEFLTFIRSIRFAQK